MAIVYAATYNVGAPKCTDSSALALALAEAAAAGSLFDAGDDPSFFSAARYERQLTWGVCRSPLRRKLQTGDVVAFFAKRDSGNEGIDYYFKGFATVARKVSQVEVWTSNELSPFREYLNLLIRPVSETIERFRWYERVDYHADWLWRICSPDGHRKRDIVRLAADGEFVRQAVPVGANYVIFSNDDESTRILCNPLHVAHSEPLRRHQIEQWLDSPHVVALRDLFLGKSRNARGGRRGLKTTNGQQAHPHLVLDLVEDAKAWCRDVASLLA